MTQIIAFAGKKQSGKNTVCNCILAMKLAELGICKVSRLSDNGEIEVTDIFGENLAGKEFFPFKEPHVDIESLFENELGKYIRLYALADTLKEMAVSILGLERKQVFGTDKDKNSKTSLRWEDMPGVIPPGELKKKGFTKEQASSLGLLVHAKGKMSAREVLQYVGTDIFRKMNHKVWLDAFLSNVETEGSELALVSDVRFKNEIEGIQKQGGFVLGLTRDIYKGTDSHSSESEIGETLSTCNTVVENADLTIPEQNEKVYYALRHLEEVIPQLSIPEEEE
mgnify:FL=1|jgi:hypothetical protein|tara:strand:- start:41 stop:883 length:843 start_codon:yes stop_codon:yes gene_type:complete